MADKTVTFGVQIPVDTNAEDAATSVEALRERIKDAQGAVKDYSATLRNLRGSSDAVKEAKDRLKGAINANRDAISRDTLQLGKLGETLTDTSAKTKEMSASLFTSENAAKAAAAGWGALVAAALAVTAGVVGAAYALGKFILEAGNTLRTQGLMREAFSLNADDAEHMGQQIEALAGKVPKTRAELNELWVSLRKNLDATRVSGQGIVDIFNTVAQVSSAAGDDAERKIESILTRNKNLGRFNLASDMFGTDELQGTGISTKDVAKQLAENLHIGINEAQQALFMGRITIDQGAKALRDTVEKRFSKLNLRKMLDLDFIGKKFKDTLANLTSGVNLEPFLEGLSRLAKLFDTTTVTGAALKGLITDFGNAVSTVFKAIGPHVEAFFEQFIIESLKFEGYVLDVALFIKEKFGVNIVDAFNDTEIAVTAAKVAFAGLVVAIGAVAVPVAIIGAAVATVGFAIYGLVQAVKEAWNYMTKIDWSAIGKAIIDGIITGLTPGGLIAHILGMGDSIKRTFEKALGMASPSKVFREYGKQTTKGYEIGVESGSSKAGAAVAGMVGNISAPSGAKGGGGPSSVTVSLNFPNAKDAEGVRNQLTSASFKAQFTKLLEEALLGVGVPTQTPTAEVL